MILATLSAYYPIFWHGFVHYDDPLYITQNPHVLAGLSADTIRWAFIAFDAGNWHPITWLVHAANAQIFGDAAGGHHFTSALIHALNAALLFQLLLAATAARWRSLVVASLFAFHPLNVESVAWAAELKTPLCAFFFLLALGAYGRYTRKPSTSRYAAVAALFALSIASKPMAITFPCILLLVDYWPLGRVQGGPRVSSGASIQQETVTQLLLEKVPLFAICIASAIVTVAAQKTTGSVVPVGVAAGTVAPISLHLRIVNALYSYGAYLLKAVWPTHLAPFYPFPFAPIPLWRLILSAMVLISMTAAAWAYRRKKPYLVVGWLFYLGTLVPMIGLVQVGGQSMADRYAYLPLVGVFVFVVWGLSDWVTSQKWNPRIPALAAALAILFLAGCSWRQETYWKDNYTLWTHTLEVAPDNPVAEHNISIDLMQNGHMDEALSHLENSVRIDPTDVVSRINLAVDLQDGGRYQEAIEQYNSVLQQTSDPQLLPTVYENLGNIYRALGDFSKSDASYRSALRINPNRASTLTKLQDLQTDRDITAFARSVETHPTAQGYIQLGRMLRQASWIPEARDAYQKALAIDPSSQEARNALKALPDETASPKSH